MPGVRDNEIKIVADDIFQGDEQSNFSRSGHVICIGKRYLRVIRKDMGLVVSDTLHSSRQLVLNRHLFSFMTETQPKSSGVVAMEKGECTALAQLLFFMWVLFSIGPIWMGQMPSSLQLSDTTDTTK